MIFHAILNFAWFAIYFIYLAGLTPSQEKFDKRSSASRTILVLSISRICWYRFFRVPYYAGCWYIGTLGAYWCTTTFMYAIDQILSSRVEEDTSLIELAQLLW
jgi:hypothetical protein